MPPTLAELSEETQTYLPALPGAEIVEGPGLVYHATEHLATVHRVRRAEIDWVRRETRRRGLTRVEWWIGWSAPDGIAGELLAAGFVPDEVPVLSGMTCTTAPPGSDVRVTRVETLEELLAAVEVDWDVWGYDEPERERRRQTERRHFAARSGAVHHFCAWLGDRRVGFGRAIDFDTGVALMGGAVLAEARGRGAYRALVRARWDHAVARGTPLLVVQAGELSAPVLDGLGFVRHGDLHLFVDPAVASGHGDDGD